MAVTKTVLKSVQKHQQGNVIAIATYNVPDKIIESIKDENGLDFVKVDYAPAKLADYNAVNADISSTAAALFA